MFKIICEIHKLTNKKEDGTTLVYFTYTNCQPCHFSEYQMFSEEYDKIGQIQKAHIVAQTLDGIGLDLNIAEYKNLKNKIYHINDMSNYRYITLFDENMEIKNISELFIVPWIYSAIIRYLPPSAGEQLCEFWNDHLSSLHHIQGCQTAIEDRKYKTIWEKRFLFHLNDQPKIDRLIGTLQKSSYKDETGRQYYGIDEYFLKFLFSGQPNKCLPFSLDDALPVSEQLSMTISQQIYQDYQAQLPNLLGLKLLEFLDRYALCVIPGTKPLSKTMISDETEKFILPSTVDSGIRWGFYLRKEACTQVMNGILQPLSASIEYIKYNCKDFVKNGVLDIGNELYKFNCSNFDEVVSLVANEISNLDSENIYG